MLPSAFPKITLLAAAMTAAAAPIAQARPPTSLQMVRKSQPRPSAVKPSRTPAARSRSDQHASVTKPDAPVKRARASSVVVRDPYAARPPRPGYVVLHGPFGAFAGLGVTKQGRVLPTTSLGFERMLACRRTGKRWPIHERLIRVITQLSDHFGGRPLRVVSGFRPWSPEQYTTESRHNVGRALDFSVIGVPNEAVRDFCRTLPDVGCGYYPHSSFVHLDVRETKTYWVDYSGPGEAPRYAHARARMSASGAAPARGEATDKSAISPSAGPRSIAPSEPASGSTAAGNGASSKGMARFPPKGDAGELPATETERVRQQASTQRIVPALPSSGELVSAVSLARKVPSGSLRSSRPAGFAPVPPSPSR